MCVGIDCNEQQCIGNQCYSSVIIRNGVTAFKRGCLVGRDSKWMTCTAAPSASHIVECCSQHMCNANVSKETLLRQLRMSEFIDLHCLETKYEPVQYCDFMWLIGFIKNADLIG